MVGTANVLDQRGAPRTLYRIAVGASGGERWSSLRGFSEFRALHRRLVHAGHSAGLLPEAPARFGGLNGATRVAHRMELLDRYLVALLTALGGSVPALDAFLSPADHGEASTSGRDGREVVSLSSSEATPPVSSKPTLLLNCRHVLDVDGMHGRTMPEPPRRFDATRGTLPAKPAPPCAASMMDASICRATAGGRVGSLSPGAQMGRPSGRRT